MPTLTSNRLQLRDFREADIPALFKLYQLPEISRFESWGPMECESQARDLVNFWIEQQSQTTRRQFTFAVTLTTSQSFIGLCGLDQGFGTETDDPRAGFVGYRYFPEYWNRGFATEALVELVRWSFEDLELHRVHSGCAVSNAASARVLEKVGMRHEGTTRQSFPMGDTWVDYLIYGLLQEDYDREGRSGT